MEKNERNQILKKRILPTILVSILLPIMVCICIPFEIYANNSQEFLFAMTDFIWCAILFALIVAIIIFFTIFFLPNNAYRIVSSLIIAFSFMFFVQGLYLNSGLNSLVGDKLADEEPSIWLKIGNLAIWFIVLAGAVILSILKDKKGYISMVGVIVSVVVIITQIMTLISISISNKDVFASKVENSSGGGNYINYGTLTNKNLTNISSGNNIFYFCIDKFDGRYAEYTYDNKPEVFNELSGFTWFKDNVARYSHTFPSVANMLTRNKYDVNKSRVENLKAMYKEDDTLSVLEENDYEINLFTQTYHCYDEVEDISSNIANSSFIAKYEIESNMKLAITMMQMSLYRSVPLFFKNLIGNIDSSVCNSYIDIVDDENNPQYSLENNDVYDIIKHNGFNKIDKKQFTFIHLVGCHEVDVYENSIESVEDSLKIVNEYLKAMKEFGVYEDATIIVTGDHSCTRPTYKQTTALFVKPSGEADGDMKTSMAQTSHDNIWATIMKSENIETENDYGKSVFEIDENEDQTRYYTWHTWWGDLVEEEYKIIGSAKDLSNWIMLSNANFDRNLMD